MELPGSWSFDASMSKTLKIAESKTLQIRMDATNVFNHPYLSDPYNVLGDTADWGALGSLTGEVITGAVQANAPRTIQLGLRLSF